MRSLCARDEHTPTQATPPARRRLAPGGDAHVPAGGLREARLPWCPRRRGAAPQRSAAAAARMVPGGRGFLRVYSIQKGFRMMRGPWNSTGVSKGSLKLTGGGLTEPTTPTARPDGCATVRLAPPCQPAPCVFEEGERESQSRERRERCTSHVQPVYVVTRWVLVQLGADKDRRMLVEGGAAPRRNKRGTCGDDAGCVFGELPARKQAQGRSKIGSRSVCGVGEPIRWPPVRRRGSAALRRNSLETLTRKVAGMREAYLRRRVALALALAAAQLLPRARERRPRLRRQHHLGVWGQAEYEVA